MLGMERHSTRTAAVHMLNTNTVSGLLELEKLVAASELMHNDCHAISQDSPPGMVAGLESARLVSLWVLAVLV